MKFSFRWIGLLVGLGLFSWVLRSQDLSAVWDQAKSLEWRFGWILLFYVVIFGLDTLGWRFALRPRAQIRWDHLFKARLAGEAVNYVTPTAWVGGEPVKAHLLSRRFGIPLADGMASVVIAKATFSISMFFFILTGVLLAIFTQPLDAPVFRWVWILLPVLGVLLLGFALAQFLQPFRRGASLLQWAHPRWFQEIEAKVKEWDLAIVTFYRESSKAVLCSFGFHFLGWVAGVLEVYLILQLLHVPVSLTAAWALESLWLLFRAGAFFIPASLGASEGSVLLICLGLGISAASGLALALVRRARELVWVGLGLIEISREGPLRSISR